MQYLIGDFARLTGLGVQRKLNVPINKTIACL